MGSTNKTRIQHNKMRAPEAPHLAAQQGHCLVPPRPRQLGLGHHAAALAEPGTQLPAQRWWCSGGEHEARVSVGSVACSGIVASAGACLPAYQHSQAGQRLDGSTAQHISSLGGRLLLVARAAQDRLQRLAAHQHRLA